ncbi:MAG TPA: stage II sporulation protein M [Anaerolineales bacterium]|nr:stage II sporulation protein M [Anaerolineales bacterium]
MPDDLQMIWLVMRRELRDQFRDWRILTPLIILTLSFPLLMNEVAKEAVAYINQYGANLIVDRLVPFSILIIGFFPITISLVVALESFVGEKERGTIEPLLSSPIENWHLYFGKLLVGIFTPLLAGYASIVFYVIIVSRQDLHMPDASVFTQLFMLTTAHAILMVSAAIVISVQSTTVRAANLLASFIVVPVAILMQGESALLFWGNDQVLWLAVLAVMVMASLLIRVGLAHFQREYLLGREFDTLNLRWIWKTFWGTFRGKATTLTGWYSQEVARTMRQLVVPFAIIIVLGLAGYLAGYHWATVNVPRMLPHATTKDISEIVKTAGQSAGIAQAGQHLSATFIFGNNVRATLLVFLGGMISFSVLGLLVFLLNIGLVGGVLGIVKLIGYSPLLVFAAGLLPHGIFEIPALMIASAIVLRIGAVLVTPQLGKSMGQILLELLADWAKIFIGLVVPLLAVAAVIEAYITPAILAAVLK